MNLNNLNNLIIFESTIQGQDKINLQKKNRQLLSALIAPSVLKENTGKHIRLRSKKLVYTSMATAF